MIKTLRTTSVALVVLAAVFIVLSAVYGSESDQEIEKLLESPGALEKFNKAKGAKPGRSETPPLVTEAKKFALYLNPPAEAPKRRPSSERSKPGFKPPEPKKDFSIKFDLIGVSYYSAHPDRSLALIDEPGKGLVWVTQGSEIGHSVIEQIKQGVVVVRSGKTTSELTIKQDFQASASASSASANAKPVSKLALSKANAARKKRRASRSNVARKGSASRKPAGTKPSSTARPGTKPVVKKPPSTKPARGKRKRPPYNAEQSEAMMKEVIDSLAMMQKEVSSKAGRKGRRRPHPAADDDGGVERMKKLLSQLEAMRVTKTEATELGDLGRKLDDARSDPNRPRGGSKVEKGSSQKDDSGKK